MDLKQSIFESTQYIHRLYGEPLTIADISSRAYLSPSYFTAVFRAITGYSVKNYLNRYRLYRAAQDLINSGKPIVEIAFISGFSSQQAFTKSFSIMYGIAPAQFRMRRPKLDLFPPDNIWEEQVPSMELMECFKTTRFMHKDAFFVAGVEVDINYRAEHGTDPISAAWSLWLEEKFEQKIPDKKEQGVIYGITHSETADDLGKYIVCAEVKTLNNLPVGLVGRRFPASDFAVFDTTLEIIWTGAFWRTFYTTWLPQSGYSLPDEALHESYCTFSRYPAIEVYGQDFKDNKSVIQIYAPVVKQ
jgi:AraC family transcriptional regulator